MIFGMIANAISSISSVASTIGSVVGSIGSSLSSFATSVAPVIGRVIEAVKPVAGFISQFANIFLQAMNILKPEEKVEDLGERALQAADEGITSDGFENFSDYLDALRNFDLDEEASAQRNPVVKLVAGLGVGSAGLEQRFNAQQGSLGSIWVLPITNPAYFTPERMQHLVEAGRLGGNILAYLENRLSGGDARAFEKKLEFTADGKAMDDGELGSLYGALDSAQGKCAELAKQLDQRDASRQGDA